jgi:hypothetical protein
MAPFKSSRSRSAAKLLGVFRESDLSLRGGVQSSRTPAPGPLGASGGNIADALEPGNGYVYHTFSTPGTFTCQNTNTIEILVVGGGGATNQFLGGGGGGGGVCHATDYEVEAGPYAITVGPGGTATHPGPDTSAGNGGDSYFGASGPARLTGYGGGRGAKYPEGTYPFNPSNPDNNSQTGGAGAAGGDYPSSTGGAGQPFPQFAYPLCFPSPYLPGLTPHSPNNTHYAGGGGGGRHLAGQGSNDGTASPGGDGGGGTGGNGQPVRETDGVDYLGGGGGDGGGYEPKGSDGGSGIVIIRYPTAVK